MIEMQHGETTIKVMRDRVAEMERKGWKVAGEEPVQETQKSEEISDGDSHGF